MGKSSDWDFSTLAQAGRAIAAASSDPHELAEVAYLEFSRLLPVDFFQLGLFEGNQYQTLILIQDGNREENQVHPLDIEKENIVGWVRRTGKSLIVHDFQRERSSLPAQPAFESEDPPVSGLFLPLRVSNATVGILALQSREANTFTTEHLQVVSILGNSLIAPITGYIFHKETEEITLQLVLMQEISRLLLSLTPLTDRLQQVLGLILEVLGYAAIEVFEIKEQQLILRSSTHRVNRENGETEIPEIIQRCVAEASIVQESIAGTSPDIVAESLHTYAIPLLVVDHTLGALHIHHATEIDLAGDEGRILEMLANQLGFAMLEAQNYDERQEETWITTVLLEVAKHAAQPGDMLVALQAVLQLSTLLAGTEWAILLLPDESGTMLHPGVHAGFRRQQSLSIESIRLNKAAFNLAHTISENELPERISLPQPLAQALDQSHALCLKLTDGNNLLGLLLMQDHALPGIRPSLLAGIGHQVSLRLENARLIEEAALRRSLERELMMARNIQSSFLPESTPSVPGWEVASAWEVAREVGGDFYDFIPLAPDTDGGQRWGIVIADVADKGVPAALYMALCRTMLRSVAQNHVMPGRTLEIVNRQLISDTRADLFVSVFYAVWDPANATLTFANAGHPPPILFRTGARAELIREHGMVLGVMPELDFTDQTLHLGPGDLLVLYTDGVSEAHNSEKELFGFQRIESLILSQEDKSASSIAGAIVERVVNFSEGNEFSDDLTAVALRRQP